MTSPSARFVAPVVRLHPTASLFERLRAGEPRAGAELFDRHVEKVERAVQGVLGSDAEVEDVVQDAFVAALHGIAGFRGNDASLGPWVRGIAVRLALKRLRWRRVRRWFGAPREDAATTLHALSDTRTQVALGRAYALLDRLPAVERAAFGLRYFEGMRLEEVADTLGVSLATSKRRLRAARERFRRLAAEDALLRDWLDEDGGS